MNDRYRSVYLLQAARGPVVLITVGALFAIQQAGILSFGRTWPLILIVLGVMKLLERLAAPPVIPPPPGARPPYNAGVPPTYDAGMYPPPAAPPPPPQPPYAPPPPPPGGRRL